MDGVKIMPLIKRNDINQIFASQAPAQDTPPVFTQYTGGWGAESRPNNGKNMSVEIFLPIRSLNSLQRYMIEKMDILPRPMGVQYKFTNVSGKEFGFDGFFNSYGFNEGSFIDT